jgi:outer membrane protein OmpA-like peptidoglycan-associated protein
MKRLLPFLLFFSLYSCSSSQHAQTVQKSFGWNDTVFVVGSQKSIYIRYGIEAPTLTDEAKLTLDTLANFLKKNKGIKVELGVYMDQQGDSRYNMILSQHRAESCVNVVRGDGIDSARIIPKGYGDTKLLIPTRDIERMKTKEEKQEAYRSNRRTIVTITGLQPVLR